MLRMCDRFKKLPDEIGAHSVRLLWLLAAEGEWNAARRGVGAGG